jgi:hypothetical protein
MSKCKKCKEALMQRYISMTDGNRNIQIQFSYRQQGALLPMALIMLFVVTLLGVSAVSTTNVALQIAGNQQHQFEAEMVAENAVNWLVDNYPSPMPTSTTFKTFGLSLTPDNLREKCITKTGVQGHSYFYSYVNISITTTDPISGATATAVKGLKYRGAAADYNSDSAPTGSPTHADCYVAVDTIKTITEDPDLTTNGQKKVLYSYLEID